LRQIKTTFRNLRNINTEENKIISNTGVSIEEAFQTTKPTLYLFSLNTTGLKTQSAAVARMLIADVKQNMNVIRQNDKTNNMMMILDEFGSFATPDITELQEQGRSKGFQIIYGIQTLANLTAISESFASRIIGNCNTYVIHRTKEDKGVETIANIIGTNPAYEATERHSEGVATGEQSVREVQQYIFHPKDIRQLENHYALVCTMFNNKVTPFKGAIKIDYADIKDFITKDSDNVSYVKSKQKMKFTPKELPVL
jgi:type IV secretory pathway TraG/TraD family ATPase VirD4